MKHTKQLAIITLLLVGVGVGGAFAQSLGDYARAARKNKPEPTTASRHFDNDNLPIDEKLSVVGPAPSSDAQAGNAQVSSATMAAAAGTPTAAGAGSADRQKDADEWQKKFDKQKEKIDSLNHELDLDQREYHLRAAAMYGDAGARLRNAAEWDKQDTQYKNDIEGKQKALEAARQELDQLQEQARKAGVAEKDKDAANTGADRGKDVAQDKALDKDKDK
jgi:hypothetical protein